MQTRKQIIEFIQKQKVAFIASVRWVSNDKSDVYAP